ncbi:MAG: glycosyltransferase [Coriobacteriaceae bacterium]|nr:glycosyltransferase [Coriobacteriaceae bacterium]
MKNIWIFSVFSAPPEYEMRYRTSKMAQEFVKNGDKVTIFASSAIHNTNTNLINDRTPYIVQTYNDVDYVFVRCSDYKTNGPDRIASLLEFYFRLRHVVDSFDKPDCIVAESPYPTVAHSGILAARKYGVPCVTEIRDLWPESIIVYQGYSRHNPMILALDMLERWIYQKSDALVFTMPGGWDYIKSRNWEHLVRKDKVFHINNGVDLAEFDDESRTVVYHDTDLEEEGIFTIVYSGSIRLVNDLRLVVDAAQILQNESRHRYRFLLFGDGDQRPILESHCRQQGIDNVVFKGFVEKRFIPSIVCRADANLISVAASSLGRFGNSWNKMFEYLAAGKPIISNCRNEYDLIEEFNCGVVSSSQDGRSIAKAIEEVASLSPIARQTLGIRARRAAQEFDFPRLAQRLRTVIKGTMGSEEPVELVSLCTIAYNEEETIEDLFEAFKAQDFPHHLIEIVLVDGASTDGTKAMMEQFAASDHDFYDVKVLDNPKRVQPSGWNVAINNSRGDVIVRVDAHAYIPADFIRKNVETLERGEDVCGGVRPVRLHQVTPWTQTLLLAESSIFGSSVAVYRRDVNPGYVSSIFHGAYRREVFEKAGLFDERLIRTEDNEIHYRIRKAGYRIKMNPLIHSYQYVRSTFRKMIRQKEHNGYWIGRTLFISPWCLRPYHMVPLLFVLALIGSLVLGLTCSWLPIIALMAVYLVVNLAVSAHSLIKTRQRNRTMIALPLIFFIMHIVYGWGTIVGIVSGAFRALRQRLAGSGAEVQET